MPQIRTRQLQGSTYPPLTYGTNSQSYINVETVAGSPLVGDAVARALRGEQSMTIFIDGDSNEEPGGNGILSQGSRNLSLLAAQDSGLVRSGFTPGGFSYYTTTIPVRSNYGAAVETRTEFKTNLVLQSQNLGISPWSAGAGGTGSVPTVTSNYTGATAPDGTMTATRLQLNRGAGVNGLSRVQQLLNTGTAGVNQTMSIWMKLTSGSTPVQVGLRLGGDGTYLVNHTVTDTWQRFQYTVLASGPGTTTNVDAQILLWTSMLSPVASSQSADIVVWGCQVEMASSASAYIPTTTVAVSHTTMLTPMLPPSWLTGSHQIRSAPTSGDGMYFNLQSKGTHVDPRFGVGAGADTPWWSQTAGETYCDIYLLKIKLDGYGSEVIAKVTATDVINGVVTSPTPVQTYTSGSGGIPAVNLNASDYTTNDIAVVRIPVTFQDSGSVTRLVSQVNITGSGGKVVVCGVEFVRPNAKGIAFSVISGKGGYTLAKYVSDHTLAGPVYKVISDRAKADGGVVGYWPQACVNDSYVDSATAAQFKATVESRIAQIRQATWMGGSTFIMLPSAPYRDSGTNSAGSNDTEFDNYPSAMRNIATQGTTGIVALNVRKYLHKLGFNRASENPWLSGSLWTIPSSVRGGSVVNQDNIDQWRLNGLNPLTTLVDYSYASGTLASFPSLGYMVSVQTSVGAADHPLRNGSQKWYAARQWLTIAGSASITTEPAKTATDVISTGVIDLVHFRGNAVWKIRSAETHLLLQTAATLR